VPDSRRGFYTSFIQTTASLGLFTSLVVILITSNLLGDAEFARWGWRIPFVLSVFLVAVSFYIRMQLGESPLFAKLKKEGNASATPIKESFDTWPKWKVGLEVLFGVTAGQAGTYYTSHFYALFFLQTVLKVPAHTAYTIVAIAVVIGTPAFVLFGTLSDRYGRKRIMMAGNLLSALSYFILYRGITAFSSPLNEPAIIAIIVFMIALAAMVVALGAGVMGMLTHNTPLFIGGWIALAVSTVVLIVSLLLMLNDAKRRRLAAEQYVDPPAWNDDD
jgi:MFS family permease